MVVVVVVVVSVSVIGIVFLFPWQCCHAAMQGVDERCRERSARRLERDGVSVYIYVWYWEYVNRVGKGERSRPHNALFADSEVKKGQKL